MNYVGIDIYKRYSFLAAQDERLTRRRTRATRSRRPSAAGILHLRGFQAGALGRLLPIRDHPVPGRQSGTSSAAC